MTLIIGGLILYIVIIVLAVKFVAFGSDCDKDIEQMKEKKP